MRRTLRLASISLAAICALGAACSAHAQDTPKVDVSAGYSYMHSNVVVSGVGFSLNGASGSVAYNVNNWFGVVADFGVYHQGNVAKSGFTVTPSTYLFGPRFSYRKNEHLTPFVQALFGAGHVGGSLYTSSLGAGLAPLGTNSSFALSLGGGVDYKINSNFSIRIIQTEYLFTQFKNANDNQQQNFRLTTGVVFHFGKR